MYPQAKYAVSNGEVNIELCQRCAEAYQQNHYCDFCIQVYHEGVEFADDGLQWISCDRCSKWVSVSRQFGLFSRFLAVEHN